MCTTPLRSRFFGRTAAVSGKREKETMQAVAQAREMVACGWENNTGSMSEPHAERSCEFEKKKFAKSENT